MSIQYTCHLCNHNYTIWSDDDIVAFGGAVWFNPPTYTQGPPEDDEGKDPNGFPEGEPEYPEESQSTVPQLQYTGEDCFPLVLKTRCPNCLGVYNINMETLAP